MRREGTAAGVASGAHPSKSSPARADTIIHHTAITFPEEFLPHSSGVPRTNVARCRFCKFTRARWKCRYMIITGAHKMWLGCRRCTINAGIRHIAMAHIDMWTSSVLLRIHAWTSHMELLNPVCFYRSASHELIKAATTFYSLPLAPTLWMICDLSVTLITMRNNEILMARSWELNNQGSPKK